MSAQEQRDSRARRRAIAQRKKDNKRFFAKQGPSPEVGGPSKMVRIHEPWCDEYIGERHVDFDEDYSPLDFHDGEVSGDE